MWGDGYALNYLPLGLGVYSRAYSPCSISAVYQITAAVYEILFVYVVSVYRHSFMVFVHRWSGMYCTCVVYKWSRYRGILTNCLLCPFRYMNI